ncbi:MAG: hypothetical protein HXX17_11900 [Geobacteraceae bacterium]|nr:hypothetical protein [Geobacteraceae bacterium]
MKRLIMLLLFCSLFTPSAFAAGFTIYIAPQLPEYVTVNGPYGQELIINPAQASAPAGLGKEICRPDNYSPYSTDPARRTRVFADTNGTATSPDLFTACPQIRAAKEREIRSGGSIRLLALTQPYSGEERESWDQQADEAALYQTDNNCPCSMIRDMASTRGIPLALMAQKILENATLFKSASGQILGYQQKLIDRIYSETDFARLLAIGWE